MNPEKEYSVWSAGGIGSDKSKSVKPPPINNSYVQEGCEQFTETSPALSPPLASLDDQIAIAKEHYAVKDERDCLRDKVVILNEALRIHKEALGIALHVMGEHNLQNAIERIKQVLKL